MWDGDKDEEEEYWTIKTTYRRSEILCTKTASKTNLVIFVLDQ